MSWTDDRVDLLRKLWADGLSASQIAGELGGVTRNAVIGKVHRLGLSGRAKSNAQSTASRQKRAARNSNTFNKPQRGAAKSGLGNGKMPATGGALRPAPAVDVPKPKALMLDLLELNEQTCKFPVGDPQESEFGFCGAKARDGDPYCEYHCRLAYQPVSDRRRDKDGQKPRLIANGAAPSGRS